MKQLIGKPAARGGTGVRKQGSGFSAPGINERVTFSYGLRGLTQIEIPLFINELNEGNE